MKTLAVCLLAVGVHAVQKESTITKVVNVLKEMLDKSKVDGDAEVENFAKFKCYCDTNTMDLNNRIDEAKKNINVLSNQIEELQGSNGGASSKCAQLKTDMAANEAARMTQENLRNSDHEGFVAEESDLVAAIAQMDAAIQTLSEVGADQTLSTGADHEQMMKGKTLVQTSSSLKMKQAMDIVTRFLGEPIAAAQAAFLQKHAHTAPFTGTYTSQSGQIVGTLKSMRDTFEQNLETSRRKEAQQLDAHTKFMQVKVEEFGVMDEEYNNQQGTLGGNDGNLATAKNSLASNKQQLSDDTQELSDLTSLCEEKTEQYEKRKSLRAQEDAAIAEAISILDSDAAFAAFSKQDSTNTGSHVAAIDFLQLRSRRIRVHTQDHLKAEVRNALLKSGSPRVMKIASLLQAENVFDTVLKEIANMKTVIQKERETDNDNLNWCNGERTDYDARVVDSTSKINNLNADISGLDEQINHPETGLIAEISSSETELESCRVGMKEQTDIRTKENLAYQQNIKDNVAAQKILTKATAVLKKYYENMDTEGTGFLQKKGDILTGAQAAGDATNAEGYSGQSGKGNDVIGMLEFIHEETVKEEMLAHENEESAQHEYEDAMQGEKAREEQLELDIAGFREDLATAEETLENKQNELKDETQLLADAEAYLLKIKPGCDFITKNIDERESNRQTEEAALTTADTKIRDTPVYKAYEAEAHSETFGECRETCDADEDHVECKACRAKTSIPGYCAGHAGTKGC